GDGGGGGVDGGLGMTPGFFAHNFAMEATRPTANEIAQLGEILKPGTSVYVPAVPTAAPDETVAAAAALRKAGLEPVIHVAAKRLTSADVLRDVVSGLDGDDGMRFTLDI